MNSTRERMNKSVCLYSNERGPYFGYFYLAERELDGEYRKVLIVVHPSPGDPLVLDPYGYDLEVVREFALERYGLQIIGDDQSGYEFALANSA